jgi:uncharacterized membrane protein YkgB
MILRPIINNVLNAAIPLIWLINGLYCKLLNLEPRHQAIVGRILGENNAVIFTKLIGVLEILMAIWILSKVKSRWCAIMQMTVIAIMNVLEFILVPDLLLFGKMNAILAFLLIIVIGHHEFRLKEKAN